MLQLLFGPVRSGKTGAVFEAIGADLKEGRRAVLLVPEQASFVYERRVSALGSPDAQALSFSRFAELVLRSRGGDGRRRMTDTAAYFLMELALEEVSDALALYRRQVRTRGFLSQMLQVAQECALAGVSPQDLARVSASLPAGTLRDKTAELSLILDAYSAVMHRGHIDEADVLTLAADCLAEHADYAGARIYVESFSSFTAPEYRLLESLLRQADTVTVSLIGDGVSPAPPAFAASQETARRLIRMAEALGVPVKRTVLPEREGKIPQSLLHALRDGTLPPEGERSPNVCVFIARNPAEEADRVAAMAARLTREEGYRCRDIAIVMRSDARYRTALPAALRRCGVAFFDDRRTRGHSSALLRGVTDAVLAAAGDRRADPALLLKSPLLGLDPAAAGETENYCFVWSVRPHEWLSPFLNNPDGMTDRFSEEARERLARIEECRRAVAAPLARLQTAVRAQNGRRFAEGVWRYLGEVGAAEHLTQFAQAMEPAQRREFLQQQSLLWDRLTEVLDLFAGLPRELDLPAARITELFELALSTAEVATPPHTLDEVAVGTADRMRIDDARVVFLLGAVQGEFPPVASPVGLLTDEERRALVAGGLDLFADSESLLRREELLVYTVAAAAKDRLIVSLPAADFKGEALEPSVLYRAAAAVAAPCGETPFADAVSPESALRAYAASERGTADSAALRRACELAGLSEDLARIDRAAQKTPHQIEDAPLARRLFGERMDTSATRLGDYYTCPYSYFVKHGLRVRALEKAELSPAKAGTLVHRVLERVVSRYGGAALAALPEETLRGAIAQEIRGYLSDTVEAPELLPKRLQAGFDRIGDWLFELLRRLGEEFAQSRFEPVAFELPIGGDSEAGGLRLKTVDGGEIAVYGSVDRVDVATVNGRRYVRVVDYKSGGKTFSLSDVYYGLNLQMLVYLFSIWKNGRGRYADLLPAGVLYMPALGEYVRGARKEDEAARRERARQYRMNGLLLEDSDVLAAMEIDGGGLFIPVRDGRTKNAFASLAQLGRLCRLVEDRMREMAESLHAGAVAAAPADPNKTNACLYCDCRTFCGFEEGDPIRALAKLDREAILGKEGDGDGTDA